MWRQSKLYRWLGLFLTIKFARFLVFGGMAAVVNLTVGELLYSRPSLMALIPYWLAVAFGAASGLVVNFSLNYIYNFRYFKRSAAAQFRTFVVVALVGVALTALIADIALRLAYWFGMGSHLTLGPMTVSSTFVAHFIAVGLVTFYSFAAHSAFSFNEGLRFGLRRILIPRR
jgi:putative flippase GtrA